MANVSGPNNRLPGQKCYLPGGTVCDEHPDAPAIARIQGETDSYGSEEIDMCQVCYDNFVSNTKPREGRCEWCGSVSSDLKHHRDPEEGSNGPVYNVCETCITTQNEAALEELEHNNPETDSVFPDEFVDGDDDLDLEDSE